MADGFGGTTADGALKLAVQRSGRLTEDTLGLLHSIGLEFESYGQRLFSHCRNFPLSILYGRDDDIPDYVDRGTVDLPLRKEALGSARQIVHMTEGKPSRTDYEVLERGRDGGAEGFAWTRVKLTPFTGRSHQLRVHMLALGHPILGDQIYAPDTTATHPRLMLHAESLSLHHPVTGQRVTFTAPEPF